MGELTYERGDLVVFGGQAWTVVDVRLSGEQVELSPGDLYAGAVRGRGRAATRWAPAIELAPRLPHQREVERCEWCARLPCWGVRPAAGGRFITYSGQERAMGALGDGGEALEVYEHTPMGWVLAYRHAEGGLLGYGAYRQGQR